MSKEGKLWDFIAERLRHDESVMLLVVAESFGSSPGRAGYKMAIAANSDLIGSIGGGVMEVNLVERARAALSEPSEGASGSSQLRVQEHRRNADQPSGMICSGEQTIIFKRLYPRDLECVLGANDENAQLTITSNVFNITPLASETSSPPITFERSENGEFNYVEKLGPKNDLYIIGGGHCALALSELMSKMDFEIRILDDRPALNTIAKNEFADEITIIDGYDAVGEYVRSGGNVYVVVMTLGYASDAVVIRQLADRDLKYFGVLGSKAKMTTLLRELKSDGLDADKLARIRTPVGIPIRSHSPEEIAVSIAAEIISVKNS